MTKTRDADVLGLLVFLQRFELDRNNGRRRGRAFLDALREFHPPEPESSGSSSIFRDPALTRRGPHLFHQAGPLLPGAHHLRGELVCAVDQSARSGVSTG